MITTITRPELQAALASHSVVLVEALPVAHYEAAHLPGALNVPDALTAEQARVLAPDPARTVVVYCSGPACARSKVTAAAFTALGYTDVRVYPGGKADWDAAGLPFEATQPVS